MQGSGEWSEVASFTRTGLRRANHGNGGTDLTMNPITNDWMNSEAVRQSEKLGLPAPRLQLTWLPLSDNWERKECVYSIVLPLGEHDIRREGKYGERVRSEWHAIIGLTQSMGGKRPVYDGVVDAPFRDSAHALWDSKFLNLPVFAVCDGVATLKRNDAK